MSYTFSLTTSNDYGFTVSSTDTWGFQISESTRIEGALLTTKANRYLVTKDGEIISPKW